VIDMVAPGCGPVFERARRELRGKLRNLIIIKDDLIKLLDVFYKFSPAPYHIRWHWSFWFRGPDKSYNIMYF